MEYSAAVNPLQLAIARAAKSIFSVRIMLFFYVLNLM
jgi:hypothetical protein